MAEVAGAKAKEGSPDVSGIKSLSDLVYQTLLAVPGFIKKFGGEAGVLQKAKEFIAQFIAPSNADVIAVLRQALHDQLPAERGDLRGLWEDNTQFVFLLTAEQNAGNLEAQEIIAALGNALKMMKGGNAAPGA